MKTPVLDPITEVKHRRAGIVLGWGTANGEAPGCRRLSIYFFDVRFYSGTCLLQQTSKSGWNLLHEFVDVILAQGPC